MEALKGTTRSAFIGFFASHIVFTIIIDAQALLPPSIYPQALKDLLSWYSSTLNDPLMSNPRNILWFQSLICCECIFQVPYFFAALKMLLSNQTSGYPDWFRSASIAYGAHTATTMAPILATLATNEKATWVERSVIVSVYLPYLVFPVWIMLLAAFSPSEKVKTN